MYNPAQLATDEQLNARVPHQRGHMDLHTSLAGRKRDMSATRIGLSLADRFFHRRKKPATLHAASPARRLRRMVPTSTPTENSTTNLRHAPPTTETSLH